MLAVALSAPRASPAIAGKTLYFADLRLAAAELIAARGAPADICCLPSVKRCRRCRPPLAKAAASMEVSDALYSRVTAARRHAPQLRAPRRRSCSAPTR